MSHFILLPDNCRRNSNSSDVAAFGQILAAVEVTDWISATFPLHVFTNKAFLEFYFTWIGSPGSLHPSLTSLSNCSIALEHLRPPQPFLRRPFGSCILGSLVPLGLALLPSHRFTAWSPGTAEGALFGLEGGDPSCSVVNVWHWASYSTSLGLCFFLLNTWTRSDYL